VRHDFRIGTLRVEGPPVRPDRLAGSIERELARLLAGDRQAGHGPGADVARAVHVALRERSLGETPR
jgi:hypothetical protein